MPPNSFSEADTTLILKPDKEIIRKENQKPISFMNIIAEILSKTSGTKFSNTNKRLNAMSMWDLSQDCTVGLTSKKINEYGIQY